MTDQEILEKYKDIIDKEVERRIAERSKVIAKKASNAFQKKLGNNVSAYYRMLAKRSAEVRRENKKKKLSTFQVLTPKRQRRKI